MDQTNGTIEMLVIWDWEYLKNTTEWYNRHLANATLDGAETNECAWDKLTSRHYDVIFYDLGMDRDEGYPMAHRIKDLKPGSILIATSLAIGSGLDLPRSRSLPQIFDGRINPTSIFGKHYQPLVELLKKYGIELLVK